MYTNETQIKHVHIDYLRTKFGSLEFDNYDILTLVILALALNHFYLKNVSVNLIDVTK